jgi:hypothetical protein
MKISNPQRAVRILFAVLIVAVGGLSAWIGRYSLCPDGISYLDIGDAFAGHHWREAINSYWSPLYPWILGFAVHPFVLSPKWELPIVQCVNLGIYLLTLCCFEFFLRSALKSIQPDRERGKNDGIPLPEWALLVLGYSIFLWSTLDLISVSAVSPDLLTAGMVYLIAGLLVRVRTGAPQSELALLGLVLGISYWSKAVMFPLGLTYLALVWFALPRERGRLFKIGIVGLFFALVSAPLILGLTYKEGRVTFGDSGWLNYATLVSPGGRVRNWQGEPPESGVPLHPTRQAYQHPSVFEFAMPIGGTYPPTYDPAYWNAGHRWTFNFRAQALVVLRHLLMYLQLFLNSQPGLVVGVLTWLALGGKPTCRAILRNWFLLAMCLSALGIYMLVHVETRFLGAQVVIAWIAILSGIRLHTELTPDKLVITLVGAVTITILISVFAGTAHLLRDGGVCSAAAHVEVAEDLESVRVHQGSKVAVFGDGDWAYWARLAHLRIVAEIMSPDTPAFWASTPEEKTRVYQALVKAGAIAVITEPLLPFVTLDDGWSRLGNTPYYIRWLKQQ